MKEGNVLFNDALNSFYLRFFGVRHMVKDHSDSEKGRKEMFVCLCVFGVVYFLVIFCGYIFPGLNFTSYWFDQL